MPSSLSSQQMCDMVRDILQIYQNGPVLRDGFTTDPLNLEGQPFKSISILRYLNESMRQLQVETGYVKCREVINLSAGVWEYTLSTGSGLTVDASINTVGATGYGRTLQRTTMERLDLLSPSWQDTASQVQGRPTEYYSKTDIIGFQPVPDQAYTVYMLVDTLTDDLPEDNPLAVPTRIPDIYQFGGIVARTAMDISAWVDLENPLSDKRIAILNDRWTTAVQGMKDIVEERGEDYANHITVSDPRSFFNRGVSS